MPLAAEKALALPAPNKPRAAAVPPPAPRPPAPPSPAAPAPAALAPTAPAAAATDRASVRAGSSNASPRAAVPKIAVGRMVGLMVAVLPYERKKPRATALLAASRPAGRRAALGRAVDPHPGRPGRRADAG